MRIKKGGAKRLMAKKNQWFVFSIIMFYLICYIIAQAVSNRKPFDPYRTIRNKYDWNGCRWVEKKEGT